MVAKRIVPCLDVTEEGVVKGVKFRRLKNMGDPIRLARRYEKEGADEIVVLKIDAWRGRALRPRWLRRLARELSIPLTVGGGIGSVGQAEELLAAGADRVSLNTLALERPRVIDEAAERFGRQAVVLAIDAETSEDGAYRVRARGGTTATAREAVEWAQEGARRGAGELLVTSIRRDGTGRGFDLPLLRRLRGAVHVPIMASGGARDPSSFLEVFTKAGVDSALAAGMFHRGEYRVDEVKRYLSARGVEVRR